MGCGGSSTTGPEPLGLEAVVVASGFVSDWPGQIQAQLLGVGVILVRAGLLAFILFQTVIAVTDAWARTGLELSPPSFPRSASTQRVNDDSPEEQVDPQSQFTPGK